MKIRYSWDDDAKKNPKRAFSIGTAADTLKHFPFKFVCGDSVAYMSGMRAPFTKLLRHVNIPKTHCGLSVTLGKCAFESSKIKSARLHEEIRVIPELAFGFCNELEAIDLGDSVVEIEKQAFQGCGALREITIGRECAKIGRSAFYGCTGLRRVNISDLYAWCNIKFGNSEANPLKEASVMYLNGEAITELVIPEGTEEIGDYAFIGCKGINKVILPESIIRIGKEAFAGCSSLTEVSLSGGIESIGENAFSGCESLVSIAFQGTEEQWDYTVIATGNEFLDAARLDYVTTKEVSAELLTFEPTKEGDGCCVTGIINSEESEAETLVIPRKHEGLPVLRIGNSAFTNALITSVRLPHGLKEIGDEAFANCENLREIHIPESVIYVSDSAFAYCESLKKITGKGAKDGCLYSNGRLVRCSATGADRIIIPEGVTEIGAHALPRAIGIFVPYSVKHISCDLSERYVTYDGTKKDWENISVQNEPKALYTK